MLQIAREEKKRRGFFFKYVKNLFILSLTCNLSCWYCSNYRKQQSFMEIGIFLSSIWGMPEIKPRTFHMQIRYIPHWIMVLLYWLQNKGVHHYNKKPGSKDKTWWHWFHLAISITSGTSSLKESYLKQFYLFWFQISITLFLTSMTTGKWFSILFRPQILQVNFTSRI